MLAFPRSAHTRELYADISLISDTLTDHGVRQHALILAGVDIAVDNPVGRVPESRRMARVSLSQHGDGWQLGRRRGSWDGSLKDQMHHLDNAHEVQVIGRTPEGATAQVSGFLHRAAARGTYVSGEISANLRSALPADLAATIAAPSGAQVGDLDWDVNAVLQRRGVLRPLMPRFPSVSLVLVSRRADLVVPMVRRLSTLDYPDLQLVVGLHGQVAPPELAYAAGERDLVVREYDADEVFGTVIDQAFACASGELVGKVDDDDYVSDQHLMDLVMAHHYSSATLVGKSTTVVFLEAIDTTVRRLYGAREAFTHRVSGATFLMSQADLAGVGGWAPVPRAVDTVLINAIRRHGGTIYQPHDIGYLYIRKADPSSHTWSTGIGHFLRNTREQWVGLLRHPEFGTECTL